MENKEVKYFPGLNSLRFFAALSVIIGHVELIKGMMGFESLYLLYERLNFGGLGVYFFFVLSGFLITYLLLKEKETKQNISLKKFYLRRILRIWPLYFLILIFGFFILPRFSFIDINYLKHDFQTYYGENLVLYLLILPNLAFSLFSAVPHIGQSWSIGVEEQFYLIWPIMVKKVKSVFKLILVSLVVLLCIKTILLFLSIQYSHVPLFIYVKKFVAMSKFESMMIGAFGAYVFFENKTNILTYVYNPIVFYSSLFLFFPLNYFFFNHFIQNGIHIPISIMFAIIILNVATNPQSPKLEVKWLNYLGNISYGIYMYHLMVIPFVIYVFKNLSMNNPLFFNVLVYIFSIGIPILLSSFSYRFFEAPFLKIKQKFEIK